MIDRPLGHQLSRNRPFFLFGARGTGKTTLLNQFASRFSNVIHLDLQTRSDRQLFLQPGGETDVLRAISFLKDKELRGSGTLLILDEIGHSPEAMNWLIQVLRKRTTSSDSPDALQVRMPFITAASSFTTGETEALISQTEGMMSAIHLHPFSFAEFLLAIGDQASLEAFHETPVPHYAHGKLLDLFHLYALIGGMPAVVTAYAEERRLTGLKRLYNHIDAGFQHVISSAARGERTRNLAAEVLANIYPYAAMRVKFNGFGNTGRGSREIGAVLRMFEKHFILRMIYPYTSQTVGAPADTLKSPRLQIVDSGLVNYFSGIQKPLFGSHDMNAIFDGQVARQVVGQEILATSAEAGIAPGFWVRDKAQSTAEVDFAIRFDEWLIPVSVRSGEPGRLRALHQFVDAAPHPYAVRLHAGPLRVQQAQTMRGKKYFLMNLPYFLAGRIQEHLSGFVKFIHT